jgi:hypothetical protein
MALSMLYVPGDTFYPLSLRRERARVRVVISALTTNH